ncbi:MAG: Iron(III) transport system substrate-binding protein [Hyphomicrobiales bacterium]|nr:Iron(III) transport system substrate-binding protein [Hyphomicrobiales bacterium]
MRNTKMGVRAVFAIALGMLAGSAIAQDAAWEKTIAEGKNEKQLVLYTALVGDPTLKASVQAFEKKYGITVNVLEGRGSDIRERARVEQGAGRFIADVTYTSEGQARLIAREDKTYVVHEATPNLKGLKPDFAKMTSNGLFGPVMTIPYGMLINTSMVKPEDEPKSWADLANPKWKGKILSDDMRAIGGGYLMFFAQLNGQGLGEKFHEELAKNEPSFTRDMREAGRRVARGEFPIYVPFILNDIANLKGLPVKPLIPTEGVPFVLYGNVLMRNAPHPNAARLYIDFSMSEEAELLWAKSGMGITRAGLDDKIPEDVRAFANAKLLGTTDPDRQDEGLALAKKIYK